MELAAHPGNTGSASASLGRSAGQSALQDLAPGLHMHFRSLRQHFQAQEVPSEKTGTRRFHGRCWGNRKKQARKHATGGVPDFGNTLLFTLLDILIRRKGGFPPVL